MEISRPGRQDRRESSDFVAAEDAGAYADSAGPLLEHAVGVEWYDRYGTEVDRAAMTLCLLRRAKAGDLVVLSANPLEDIRNTRKIEWVVQSGVPHRPAEFLPKR